MSCEIHAYLRVSEKMDKAYIHSHLHYLEQRYKYRLSFGFQQTSTVPLQGFKDLYNEIDNIFEVTYIDCCD